MARALTISGVRNSRQVPAPDSSPGYLARPRLHTLLDDAVEAPVTLVAAPAGWGKSVLLSSWSAAPGSGGRLVWLTGRGEPGELRQRLESLTDAPWDERPEAPLAGGEPTGAPIVVLDGCDALPEDEVRVAVEKILGIGGRVVLGCRSDPRLPLHLWRVNGDLSEIRSDQLAFTFTETAALLSAHGVHLPYPALAKLHSVTEGWPAGLRLAALALSTHSDPDQVITDLGTNDMIADYLVAEVLDALPAELRRVLAGISVVEHVNGALVRALTGRPDGEVILADAQRRGVFVRRSPGSGEWFHLHPLLSRVIYRELRQGDPQEAKVAHRRAADWYLGHGPPAEALWHWIAAEEWHTATELFEQCWPDLLTGATRRSISAIVDAERDALRVRSDLATTFAAERAEVGDLVEMRRFLRSGFQTPQRLVNGGSPNAVRLALRLAEARYEGDMPRLRDTTSEFVNEVTRGDVSPLLAEEIRALTLAMQGTASLHLADMRRAGDLLDEAARLAGRLSLARTQICAGSQLALWYAMTGQLRAADRTGHQMIGLAERLGIMHLADLAWARLALAETCLQRDELDDAGMFAEEALDHAYGQPLMLISVLTTLARVRLAVGNVSEAHEIMLAARHEAAHAQVPRPTLRTLSLVDAELRLAAGDPPAARQRLSDWREDEPFPAWAAAVEASILLAEGRAAAAAAVVAPHVVEPAEGSSLTWTVQASVIMALAARAVGDRDRVTRALAVALSAAEMEGFRRPFATGGHVLRELIGVVAPTMGTYHLVVTDLTQAPGPASASVRTAAYGLRASRAGDLVEPLTQRELTVLRYLQGTLSNVEIASTLHVSINTVKTHVRNIYRKLNASRRREAVRRARDRRLL